MSGVDDNLAMLTTGTSPDQNEHGELRAARGASIAAATSQGPPATGGREHVLMDHPVRSDSRMTPVSSVSLPLSVSISSNAALGMAASAGAGGLSVSLQGSAPVAICVSPSGGGDGASVGSDDSSPRPRPRSLDLTPCRVRARSRRSNGTTSGTAESASNAASAKPAEIRQWHGNDVSGNPAETLQRHGDGEIKLPPRKERAVTLSLGVIGDAEYVGPMQTEAVVSPFGGMGGAATNNGSLHHSRKASNWRQGANDVSRRHGGVDVRRGASLGGGNAREDHSTESDLTECDDEVRGDGGGTTRRAAT